MLLAVLGAALCFALLPTAALASTAPTIASVSVSNVTEHDATLEAQINPNGLETTYEFWIEYAVCQGPPGSYECDVKAGGPRGSGHIAAGSTAQTISADLSDLPPNHSYTYWVVATDSDGETKGQPEKFTTPPASVEQSGCAAHAVAAGTLCGVVNPNGISVTACEFEVGTAAGFYDQDFPCSPAPPYTGNGPMQVTATPKGLEPNTTYHYRLVLTDESGTLEGEDQEFTTEPASSVVEEDGCAAHAVSAGTLCEVVNPHGISVIACEFEIGTGAGFYDQDFPCSSAPPYSGDDPVQVTATPTGLEPNTTYHYRLVLTDQNGTVEGEDQDLTTEPVEVIEKEPVSSTTTNSGSGSGTSVTPTEAGATAVSTPDVTPLVSPLGKTLAPKALTKAQELSKALKACEKKPTKQRASCRKQAEKKYARTAKKVLKSA